MQESRGKYGDETLRAALEVIHQGQSLNVARGRYGIPRGTVRRHRDGVVRHPRSITVRSSSPDFSHVYENELVTCIREMENVIYGLTMTDVRRIAYIDLTTS